MKYDEFAFFNQQLAAMLRDGIPLEGALKRLCQEMGESPLREELKLLEADLSNGTPLAPALEARQLPDLYKNMILVGMKSGDLPGALTMLADYYQRQSSLWIRLKGLMVYPLIVLFVAFLISTLLAVVWGVYLGPAMRDVFSGMLEGSQLPAATRFSFELLERVWIFPVFFGGLFLFALAIIFIPALQSKFRWKIAAFKEASISRVAAALHLLLKGGIPLPEAIRLVGQLEDNQGAADDMKRWHQNISAGMGKFSQIAVSNRIFPPMFVWTVANAGEDLGLGFNRAAEIYQSRALYKTEVALYSVLPITTFVLGLVVLSQAWLLITFFLPFIALMNGIG